MAKTGVLENDQGDMKVNELKKELRRLVNAIVVDDAGKLELYDRAKEILLALKDCEFNKSIGSKFKISSSNSDKKIEACDVPKHFCCPISNELMKDPVILASGQTYERKFIQSWLEAGNRTCPKTEQVISHTNLIPNNLVREMILQWCKTQGIELPSPGHDSQEYGITKADRERVDSLLKKVVSAQLHEQKQAAKELRSLTKRMPLFRMLFSEKRGAISQLLQPLSVDRASCDPLLQEDLVTTVLNLSILDENKKLVAETAEAIPLLIESLRNGTIETRTNAAAALFSLSALDSNKSLIGLAGALKPLIDLLEEGHPLATKDAGSAIFNLCICQQNRQRAVRDGAVKVIMEKLKDGIHVDGLLSVLTLLSSLPDAIEEMCALGSVSCLLSIIRENTCGRNKENCIVMLYSICCSDRSKLREIREEENYHGTISDLTKNGTSRAKRKAEAILERLNRTSLQHTA
ncbi:hypothetical protein ACHQM5_028117 [Ranunculus cassubicifolius]